ncbi:MAG: DUF5666 domain-containing protein [Ardenticatenaceae bacterium]|nr:DUF5666 domain-containing protein [Ardenticatenaceae bacterium]HBY98123.1 hypothetical protein [Chloroflexota bacterium]
MSKHTTIRWALMVFGLLALLTVPALVLARAPRDDEDPAFEFKGTVQSMPAAGLVGEWVIRNESAEKTFQTDASTDFNDEIPFVGACVEVTYDTVASQNLVREMELADDCRGGHVEEQEVHGVIESFPPELLGTWRVSGEVYAATASTEFERSDGPFAVGACVEVTFVVQDGENIAREIKTDDNGLCGAPGEPELQEVKGTLEAFPEGFIGTWTVNSGSSVTYAVTPATLLDRSHGDFYVGGCVEVKYDPNSPTREAHEIETESPDDCGPPLPDQPILKATGVITARPTDGLFGTWTIGAADYEAVAHTTVFKQEHGQLTTGQCAEVHYLVNGATNVATEIESRQAHDCRPESEENEAYGRIEMLPSTPDLTGTWTIGGLNYLVTGDTELKDGPFSVGLLVEVHFVRADDGTLTATSIEGKHEVEEEEQALAKVYGRIDALPPAADFIGDWTIAGATYMVKSETRLEQEEGPFELNACVEVYYHTAPDGTRTAAKIETEADEKCPSDPNSGAALSRAYGFVEQMPPTGFVGTWRIGGVQYDADASTEFEEEHGALVAGAFVEVTFTVQAGVNVAQKIETHVPPGAGDENALGLLAFGSTSLESTATPSQTWYIAGRPYLIIDATILDDSQAAFVTDQPVRVNAYIDPASGSRIATWVTALRTLYALYLPVTTH